MLSKKYVKKIRKALREELEKIPEYDVERAYDESYRYKRIKLSVDILRQVIFRRNKLGKKSLAFSVTELRKLDLSEIDFSGVYMCMSNLSYTNANINPQTVWYKNLCGANLEGLDLSGKDFTGVDLRYANLSYTNANINPQIVWYKNLYGANLEGLDLSGKDFTGVDLRYANLSYTNANINPQTVWYKNLRGANLEGLDLNGKDFTDVYIKGANLSNTGAKTEEDVMDKFIGTVKKLLKSRNIKAK